MYTYNNKNSSVPKITNNYRVYRKQAERHGKVFILKNNAPDAVLFSITKYKKYSELIEYADSLAVNDIVKLLEAIPKEDERKLALGLLRSDLD